jgi:hypothetical protein
LNKENLADITKLHKEVYGSAATVDHFPEKYNTVYTGVEYVGLIAYNSSDIPVAYYGVIPCFIRYGDKRILAAQSADTMTHPKYRFKGMFVELSTKTFELCRELGILLIFGFPNQNSHHGAINKLGWKMTTTMSCFTISVKTLPLEVFSKKISWARKMYTLLSGSVMSKKTSTILGVSNSANAEGFGGVDRSTEYFLHKKFSRSKVILIDNAKIWLNTKHGIMIGDIEGIDKNNFNDIIKGLKRLARKLGIRKIQFHSTPGTKIYNLFLENFEAKPSYPVLFQDFGAALPLEKIKFTFADIDIF